MISILRDKNNKTNRIKYLSLTILIDRVLKFRDYFLAFISSLSKLTRVLINQCDIKRGISVKSGVLVFLNDVFDGTSCQTNSIGIKY